MENSAKIQADRVPFWDNLKGLLIFLVVFGHFLLAYQEFFVCRVVTFFIYSFHMPAFVLIAGYLSRSANSRSHRSILKLFVIYLIFNGSMMMVRNLFYQDDFQLFTPYYSFWFLLSLMFWRMSAGHLAKVRFILLISICTSLLIGYWRDVTNVLSFVRTIAFFPFFIAGYKLSEDHVESFIRKKNWKEAIKAVLLFSCACCLTIMFMLNFSYLSLNDLLMYSYTSSASPFLRIILLVLAALMIVSLMAVTPARPLPLVTRWGRNSLAIYTIHRFLTFLFVFAFPVERFQMSYFALAFAASLVTLALTGGDAVTGKLNSVVNTLAGMLEFNENADHEYWDAKVRAACLVFLLLLLSNPVLKITAAQFKESAANENSSTDVIHGILGKGQQKAIDDAVRICFSGDMILLEDQVKSAFSEETGEYEFGPVFEYAGKYLSEADLAIGVLEGPLAGKEAGYSTGNYGDGITLRLNFPDSFVKSILASGIDLVTTANNHVLDKGVEGALRTLDVLDRHGLKHLGSYRNPGEKERPFMLEVRGLKIGFLAYTYASNYYQDDYFIRENPWITSILVDPESKYFPQVKASVISDFNRLKALKDPPEVVIVLPHMGTQFIHGTDRFQKVWNRIFLDAGADIVLGDHSHALQPVEFSTVKDSSGNTKNTVIVNCPGNFANSYTAHNGDATSIVELYIDRRTRQVICAGLVPMYTHSTMDGQYRAVPIHSIVKDPHLKREFSRMEMDRVREVHALMTSVMLGRKLTLDQVRERYFLFPEGFRREPVSRLPITAEEYGSNGLFSTLEKARKVCFIGDSVTAGSKNGGYGWYEPLMASFPDKTVYRHAWGGATTLKLLEKADEIVKDKADLYVIAIGTNDVRYRNPDLCAMDARAFVTNVGLLVKKIRAENHSAGFVFISPWMARENDPYTKVSSEKRDQLLAEYGKALRDFAAAEKHLYIDPNPSLKAVFSMKPVKDYLLDHIHPDADRGISLYSLKVLQSAF